MGSPKNTENTLLISQEPDISSRFTAEDQQQILKELDSFIPSAKDLQPQPTKYRSLIIGVFTVLLLIFCVLMFMHPHLFSKLIARLIERLKKNAKENSVGSIVFFSAIQVVLSWVPIPGQSYLQAVMAYLLQSFVESFLIAFLSTLSAGVVAFIFIRYLFQESMTRLLEENFLFRAISSEAEKRPWQTSIIFNILMIPGSVKNTILPLTCLTFWQFLIPKIIFYALFTGLCCNIGVNVSNFEELATKKSFGDSSIIEKANIVIGLVALVLSIVFVVYVGIKSAFILKELQRNERLKMGIERYISFLEVNGKSQAYIDDVEKLLDSKVPEIVFD